MLTPRRRPCLRRTLTGQFSRDASIEAYSINILTSPAELNLLTALAHLQSLHFARELLSLACQLRYSLAQLRCLSLRSLQHELSEWGLMV